MEKTGNRLIVAKADQFEHALNTGKIGSFNAESSFAACILPLLQALGWRGQTRYLFEALPHFADTLTLTELRNTLAHLHYKTEQVEDVDLNVVDDRLFPCLFTNNDGKPYVLLARDDKGIKVFDSELKSEVYLDESEIIGNAYFLSSKHDSQTNKETDAAPAENWVTELFFRFKKEIKELLWMTFLLNIFALLVPLFIMTVYDQVIPSQSSMTLLYLMMGIGFAIICEIVLRIHRSKFVSYIGARVENIVATATFEKLLGLPAIMTESAPIGTQVSRLKEFDVIKGLFSSTLINVVLELPFVLIFIAVIASIAGSLALIPIAMMFIFIITAMIMIPATKRRVNKSSKARAKKHGFLVETLTNLRTIKQTASEEAWHKRYRDLSAESAYTQFKSAQVSFLLQSMAQAIMLASGVATVGFGVIKVIDGEMTIGAMIATMALIWRVLSPLQNLFLTLTRLEHTLSSIKQINSLMKLKTEANPNPDNISQREFVGHILFDRVSFRYRQGSEPALLGTSFEVMPNEMLAIIGANASGKSTILKIILAMYQNQAGQVIVDGMDIRQINPLTLRQSIAYVPQEARFFHGTIAQNLRLSHPTASDEELQEACEIANLSGDIDKLPEGIETRIGDHTVHGMASGFKQRLSLARAFLKKSPILLLDEPAQTLDFEADQAFINSLKKLKGTCTIIMISHRPSHIKLCDKVLTMENGMVVNLETPEELYQIPTQQTPLVEDGNTA
ncbi:MAG: ATP-binding cassette domain-containing protein [Emcibacteraceae bacterium]|nr:ATP-binding cassette domain-containing protein [Emcibacteraceae bacterium]